jgi:hypothetical protein
VINKNQDLEIRDSGLIKIRIWENLPGFATLPKTLFLRRKKRFE